MVFSVQAIARPNPTPSMLAFTDHKTTAVCSPILAHTYFVSPKCSAVLPADKNENAPQIINDVCQHNSFPIVPQYFGQYALKRQLFCPCCGSMTLH